MAKISPRVQSSKLARSSAYFCGNGLELHQRFVVGRRLRCVHNDGSGLGTLVYTHATCSRKRSRATMIQRALLQLVQAKRAAQGTPLIRVEAAACSAGILEVYNAYIVRIRCQLRKARRGSKHWWRLANQIANRSGGQRGIPVLKRGNEWVLDC